jgi:hypothetical protein
MKISRRICFGVLVGALLTAASVRGQTILSSTDGNSGYKCTISAVSVSPGIANGSYNATYLFCDPVNSTCGSLGNVNFTVASHVATITSQSNIQIDATTNFTLTEMFAVRGGSSGAGVVTAGGNHTVRRQDCVPDGHGGWACPGLCCGAVFTDSTTLAVTAPGDYNTINFVYSSCGTVFGEPYSATVKIGNDYYQQFPMFGTYQTFSAVVAASVSGGLSYSTTLSNGGVAFFDSQGGPAVNYQITGGSGTFGSGGGHTITVSVFASGCNPTPTPSPTATASATPSPTSTPIPTPSTTPTPTPYGSATPMPTPVPTGTPGSVTPVVVPGGGTHLAADTIIDNPASIYGPIVDGLNALRDTHALGGGQPGGDGGQSNRGHLDDLQGEVDSIVDSVNGAATDGQSGLNSVASGIASGWSSASFGTVASLDLPLSVFNHHFPTGIAVPSYAGVVRSAILWVLVGCWYWIAARSIMAMHPER